MKTIPMTDLCSEPDAVLDSAQTERILISRGGKPCALLVGIEAYDAEDLQWATSSEFWEMIGQRRARGREIPLAEVEARLGLKRPIPKTPKTRPRKSADK
jgi:antitoxin (DNA-binding transcriptional repressor) of toxin-antitoxin stability system